MKALDKGKIISFSKSVTTYFGASIIPMVYNLAVNPLIAINLSPRDYAISGYYSSFSSLISPLISFYLVGYYLKEYFRLTSERRKNLYATIAKALIVLSFLVSAICFGALYLYITLFNTDLKFPVMPYLALMVFAIPTTGLLSLKLAQYRIERKARSFFILSTTTSIISITVMLLMVVILKLGAFGKLLAPFMCNLAFFLYLLYINRNIFEYSSTNSVYKSIFLFCLPLVMGAVLEYFSGGFTRTYLESIGNVNEYGIFIVGSSIGAYITTFSFAIMHTFQPDIYKAITENDKKQIIKTITIELSVIAAIVILFIITAPDIINLLTAGRYNESTPYARIIALSALTSVIYYHINDFCIISNRKYHYLITTAVGSICIIFALRYAVNSNGFIGGAWVSTMSFVILAAVNLLLLLFKRKNELAK